MLVWETAGMSDNQIGDVEWSILVRPPTVGVNRLMTLLSYPLARQRPLAIATSCSTVGRYFMCQLMKQVVLPIWSLTRSLSSLFNSRTDCYQTIPGAKADALVPRDRHFW